MEEQYRDIKKLVQEVGTEGPSIDFLQNVMSEVRGVSIDEPAIYQPLISKKAWIFISLIVIGLLVFLPFFEEGSSVIDKLDLSFFNLKEIKNPLSGFKFHTTTMYGIIFMALLFFVQITMLKRRIDKTFSL